MSLSLIILILALSAGFYSAVNIGANDVANAMATSVASGVLSIRKAVVISAVFNVFGAVLVGSHVTNTIRKGLIDPQNFSQQPNLLMFGMLAAVLGSAAWVNLATYFKLPVSTTHSIVGGVLGFGLVSVGIAAINWKVVLAVVLSWILSPIVGGFISFFIFSFIRKAILDSSHPIEQVKKIGPYFVGLVFFILTLATIYEGLENLHLNLNLFKALVVSVIVGVLGFAAGHLVIRTKRKKAGDPYQVVEEMSNPLQVLSASFESFSHGANDVANAIGPVAAILVIVQTHRVEMEIQVPVWLLLLGGVGLAIGTYAWGRGVMETVGKKITTITPTRGFTAEFGTAATVLLCSRLGLPVSTTHVCVGNVMGVGLAHGLSAVDLNVIKKIISAWIISLPAAGLFSVVIYLALKLLLG